jgi:hypothetical protein
MQRRSFTSSVRNNEVVYTIKFINERNRPSDQDFLCNNNFHVVFSTATSHRYIRSLGEIPNITSNWPHSFYCRKMEQFQVPQSLQLRRVESVGGEQHGISSASWSAIFGNSQHRTPMIEDDSGASTPSWKDLFEQERRKNIMLDQELRILRSEYFELLSAVASLQVRNYPLRDNLLGHRVSALL